MRLFVIPVLLVVFSGVLGGCSLYATPEVEPGNPAYVSFSVKEGKVHDES